MSAGHSAGEGIFFSCFGGDEVGLRSPDNDKYESEEIGNRKGVLGIIGASRSARISVSYCIFEAKRVTFQKNHQKSEISEKRVLSAQF